MGSHFVHFLGNRRIQNLLSLSAKTESTYITRNDWCIILLF